MATVNLEAGDSGVRIVGLKISTGGVEFKNPIKATVKNNRWYQANAFDCKIALYGDPAHDIAWWGSNDRIDDFPIEITFIVEGTEQVMMVGQVDKVSLDTRKGVVTVHGRDNAAYLIDTMTKETFTDKSVEVIVKTLANRVGLDVQLDDGHEMVGTLNRSGHYIFNMGATFGHAISYWDLLAWMAKKFNYYLYVDGDTLFFQRHDHDADTWQVILKPPTNNEGPVIDLNPSNVTDLILERDYNIARNTSVLVYSYNAKGKVAYSETDDQSKLYGGQKSHTMQFLVPGLKDADEANAYANSQYDSAIRHEKKFHWVEPGDLYLSCLEQVKIVQGDTAWHQTYFIESLVRTMDFKGGFVMEGTGTNSDPELANNLLI